MTAAIIAPINNLALVASEVEVVVGHLQKRHRVTLFQYNVTESRLAKETNLGNLYQLVWVASHSTKDGITLSDEEIISAENFARWLVNVNCTLLVLNSCFSAELVTTLQKYANLDIIATIDPNGVSDNEAQISASYLAYTLMSSDNTQMAVQKATGNGASEYRFFPRPRGEVVESSQFMEIKQFMSDFSDQMRRVDIRLTYVEDVVDPLVRVVQGDPALNYPPLVQQIAELREDLQKRPKPILELNATQVMITMAIITVITWFLLNQVR